MTDAAHLQWVLMTADEQQRAIRRMASQGWSEQGIAAATRLSVEQVRYVLADRPHEAPGHSGDNAGTTDGPKALQR